MKRLIIAAALIAGVACEAKSTAEKWTVLKKDNNSTVFIDESSKKANGTHRTFRVKLIRAELISDRFEGRAIADRTAIAEIEVVCPSGPVQILSVVDGNGSPLDFQPKGWAEQNKDDPLGKTQTDIACAK